jgi:hypothetical protein
MKDDKLWIITVIAALSCLLILSYFVLAPMSNKQSTINQVDTGLSNAADKFDTIREELKSDTSSEPDSGT